MKHRDLAGSSGTWHPAVVNDAYDQLFCERVTPKRLALTNLVASTSLPITGLKEAVSSPKSARTTDPNHSTRTEIFFPDFGEVSPFFDFSSERCREASTVFEIPRSLYRARSTLDRFKNEVLAWHSKLTERHIAGLNKRLEYLFEDEPESSNSQALPDISSFGVLLAFLARHPDVKTPSLGYNHDGIFSATWIGDHRLRVSLDFISPASIRWIYVDSREGLKDAVTGAGIVTIDILAGVLDVYGASNWMNS